RPRRGLIEVMRISAASQQGQHTDAIKRVFHIPAVVRDVAPRSKGKKCCRVIFWAGLAQDETISLYPPIHERRRFASTAPCWAAAGPFGDEPGRRAKKSSSTSHAVRLSTTARASSTSLTRNA